MKLSNSSSSSFASYFTDYVIDEVVADLQENNGMSEQQARDYVYNGGLEIYTTLSSELTETAIFSVQAAEYCFTTTAAILTATVISPSIRQNSNGEKTDHF